MTTNRLTRFILALTMMVVAPILWAVEVTPEQARTAARNWIGKSPTRMTAKFASSGVYDVQTSKNATGRALYHVVRLSDGGYVVTSGDTELPPVIAFSDSGTLDLDDTGNPLIALLERDMGHRIGLVDGTAASPGLKARAGRVPSEFETEWADLTGGQGGAFKCGADGKPVASKTSLSSLSDVRVSPLVQSKWGQSTWNGYNTFNYYTPNNYVCGCVATAFAQIMRYWQQPTSSVTARSYYCKVDGTSSLRTMKGGTYSWSDMPLTSSSCTSSTQRMAIGKLLYDLGVASQMKWKSGSSGTMGFAGSQALKNAFGYASSQAYFDVRGFGLESALASQTAFRDAILASLDAGMPCAVGVSGDEGGHEMVLDGYGFSGSVIFSHLNCGWSGSEDMWYNFFGENVTSYSFSYMDELGYNIHPTVSGDVLSGRVLNSSGSAVAGATVMLSGTGTSKTTTTDAKGIYAFRITSAGSYTVSATYGSLSGSTTATVTAMSVSTTATLDSNCSYSDSASNGTLGNKWGVNLTLDPEPRPVNDDFANAATISGASGSVSGTTVGATTQYGEPLPNYKAAATNTIWWVWTAPGSGDVTFSTTNTPAFSTSIDGYADTVMGVYTGSSVNSLTIIKEDDDGGRNRTSICSFSATAGTRYYIAVSGFGINQGTVKLNWLLLTAEILPDLSFSYTPTGWSAPMVVSASSANSTNCTVATFGTTDNLYVSRAVVCRNADVNTTFYTRLLVDGVEKVSWMQASLQQDYYNKATSYSIGTLAAGTHTIKVETDCTGAVAESDESNNTYTKTITVKSDESSETYTIKFNKYDGTGTTATRTFNYGNKERLPSIKNGLKWERSGFVFKGWATSMANANAGKIWKGDWAYVQTAAQPGKTLNVYAIWVPASGYYVIKFNKNDGSGAWRTVAFPYGTSKVLPSCGKGLGWKRNGFAFVGWAISTAKAADPKAGNIWNVDQATVKTAVQSGGTLNVYAAWMKGYTIRFHKNDGTDAIKAQGFAYNNEERLPAIKNGLNWARSGYVFNGWATSKANADAGKVWKKDWAIVKTAAAVGATLNVYAIWGEGTTGPANDNFANATVISGSSGTVSGSNVGATVQSGEPLLQTYSYANNTVWWAWTAPASGTVVFSTSGTGFDTVMGIYIGSSVTGLTTVTEDDDGAGYGLSRCTFTAKAGTMYRIVVAGYNSECKGTINLDWKMSGVSNAAVGLKCIGSGKINSMSPSGFGFYTGILADGTGTYALLLDGRTANGVMTGYLYVSGEEVVFSAECEAVAVAEGLHIQLENGQIVSIAPDGTATVW